MTEGEVSDQLQHDVGVPNNGVSANRRKGLEAFGFPGQAVRRHIVPEFKDIVQYLDYLNLDEPIIGLNFLEEGPSGDPQIGPKYFCKLCNQSAIFAEMVCHVIGRKHRQKYVEMKRPDLMTWDRHSVKTLGGKIMRAKAEIIERQDGRGTPKPMGKKGNEGRLNSSKAPQKQRPNRDQKNPQDLPPLLPELKDYHRRKQALSHLNAPVFLPVEPNVNTDRRNQRENKLANERIREEPRRLDFREGPAYREGYMDFDYRSQYAEDPQRSVVLERGDAPRYDYREELPHGLAKPEYYPEEMPPYRGGYSEREPFQDFKSEDVRGGNVRSAEYSPSQVMYPEGDKRRWSLERESDRGGSMNRADRQGSRESEVMRRNFSASLEGDRSRDHLFSIIRDYHHEMREPHQDEAVDRRAGAAASQRQVDVTRAISDIPEPFMRFLKGSAEDEGHGKRKKKSRFSDATPEELERTREMYGDEYEPSNPKFGGDLRPGSASMRSEISGGHYSDRYRELQGPPHTGINQRGGSESEGVFDMLSNIEIENAEEADFLKSKLCNLLKEFKTKKLEKAQNSHGRDGIPRNYSDMELDPRQPQYERTMREESHHRQPEDLDFRDWRQREHLPEQRQHKYRHPVHEEPRYSKRGRYEEESGAPHTSHLDEPPYYPERFQEPMRTRDYEPPAEEFFDSHSSAPPLHMDQESRMPRGPRYSNNLDKITSALLELVARK